MTRASIYTVFTPPLYPLPLSPPFNPFSFPPRKYFLKIIYNIKYVYFIEPTSGLDAQSSYNIVKFIPPVSPSHPLFPSRDVVKWPQSRPQDGASTAAQQDVSKHGRFRRGCVGAAWHLYQMPRAVKDASLEKTPGPGRRVPIWCPVAAASLDALGPRSNPPGLRVQSVGARQLFGQGRP